MTVANSPPDIDMFRSVRWRLVASFVLITVLAVVLVGTLALSLLERSIEREQLASMQANAEAIALQAEPLMWPVVHPAALNDLAQTAAFLGNDQVRILDSQRRMVADSTPDDQADAFVWIVPPADLQIPDHSSGSVVITLPTLGALVESSLRDDPLFGLLPPDTEMTIVRRVGGPWGNRLVFQAGPSGSSTENPAPSANEDQRDERWRSRVEQIQRMARANTGEGAISAMQRTIITPIGPANAPIGYVEIIRQATFKHEAVQTVRQALWLAGAIAVGLSLVAGLVISKGLTAPLQDLADTAEKMTAGDMSARAKVEGGSEIKQLARQFNEMAERMEQNFSELAAERDALRRFVADASHELRTPITALRNFNELLQGAAVEDPEARAEFLAESQTQLDRLEWITVHLLNISRIDAGLIDLDVADHDAGDLLEAATSSFRPVVQEKDISLSIEQPHPPLTMHCDRPRMELALSNLLDNAIKFTPRGGQVTVGAEDGGAFVRFWVQDSGPGVAPEDRARVFERFYSGGEGSGLGLAIVQSIVHAHGGKVYVDDATGEGSRFVIELPSA